MNNETVSHLFLRYSVIGNVWVSISTTQHFLLKQSFNHFSLLEFNSKKIKLGVVNG